MLLQELLNRISCESLAIAFRVLKCPLLLISPLKSCHEFVVDSPALGDIVSLALHSPWPSDGVSGHLTTCMHPIAYFLSCSKLFHIPSNQVVGRISGFRRWQPPGLAESELVTEHRSMLCLVRPIFLASRSERVAATLAPDPMWAAR